MKQSCNKKKKQNKYKFLKGKNQKKNKDRKTL